ncbi:MAG: chromosomal replication initiator protein DnaA [Dehalococcoidia bacterium]|nr:MAG: chromosomal replication initiator protein DnaA [Dehalococcoidia bacterium]
MKSAQNIWETALGELQIQVNKPNFQTWFSGSRGLTYEGDQFVIGVSNTFIAEYLEKNQRSLIEKTLIGLTGRNINVFFSVTSTNQEIAKNSTNDAGVPLLKDSGLNNKYTFDSFIVGSCNRLAYAAALGVAQNPGQSYNPLFIYGGPGLGKTHLLQSIGNMARANNEAVLYASGEQFTNDFINAIRQQRMDEFRHRYRNVDVLLIDDIQFISGKEQTEESFFHTFNDLHNSNRQIIIASDRPPKSMPLIENRLRSRFGWGLIVDIQPPGLETRLAILQAKTDQFGTDTPPDVLEYIARQIKRNIRELEGGLNRVIAYARLLRAQASTELAAKALTDIASLKSSVSCSIQPAFLNTIASDFNLTPEDLIGRRRDKEIVQARQVAMYLLKKQNKCSLGEIGSLLGGRNPSTVIHACEKVAHDIQANPILKRKVQRIQKKIYGSKKNKAY